jgi:hypothetical protein
MRKGFYHQWKYCQQRHYLEKGNFLELTRSLRCGAKALADECIYRTSNDQENNVDNIPYPKPTQVRG